MTGDGDAGDLPTMRRRVLEEGRQAIADGRRVLLPPGPWHRLVSVEVLDPPRAHLPRDSEAGVPMTIWKFPVVMDDRFTVMLPAGSTPLAVQVQDGCPVFWALVDPRGVLVPHVFRLAGTGHPVETSAERYVGTFQLPDLGLVYHLFDEGEADAGAGTDINELADQVQDGCPVFWALVDPRGVLVPHARARRAAGEETV